MSNLHRTLWRHMALLALALLLTACAARGPHMSATSSPVDPALAHALWQRYAALSQQSLEADKAFRIQMSLRYGPEGDSRRVVALLWGNNADQLRLDVMAGVGVTVAKIMEQGDHFLLYDPSENRAYFHQGNQKPLLVMGVPVPLGIGDLAALLNGQYTTVFGQTFQGEENSKEGIAFSLTGAKLGGMLTLNEAGLPVRWREKSAQGWDMSIAYSEGTSPLPRRVEISHPQGKRALILVKEREFPSQPFTLENLHLTLPEDTPLRPLKAAGK